MDRTFEEIRSEVFHLDQTSQRRLVTEIEENLSETVSEYDDEWTAELRRRVEKSRRGETTYVSAEESLARGRALIAEAKRKAL